MHAAHADAPHSSTKDVIVVYCFVSLFFNFFQSICQKLCPLIVRVSIWTDEPKVGWGEDLGPQDEK